MTTYGFKEYCNNSRCELCWPHNPNDPDEILSPFFCELIYYTIDLSDEKEDEAE